MIRPTLCAVDGRQIAPVYLGPRFVSVGGSVLDYAQRAARPSLADAQMAFRGYQQMLADWNNSDRVRQVLAREAIALAEAIETCCRQRRAAGWSNPNDADRPYGARA